MIIKMDTDDQAWQGFLFRFQQVTQVMLKTISLSIFAKMKKYLVGGQPRLVKYFCYKVLEMLFSGP